MRRLAVALLLLAAAGAAVWSWSRFAADRVAAEVCDRVASGDFAGAVEASGGPDAAAAPPDGSSAAGRTIAECRCVALAELDRLDEGLSELSAAMLAPGAADWVPPLDLTRLVVAHLRDTGRPAEAAVVARRAAAVHPDDGPLRYLEFTARATSEGEAAAAASMAAELDPAGGGHADLRLLLATVFERRADLDAARRALGDAPFAADPAAVTAWTRARLRVAALDDDLDEARRVRDAWTAAGAAPSLVLAGYATALSLAQLEDPEAPTLRMLLVAVGHGDAPPPGAVDPDRTPDPDRADDPPDRPRRDHDGDRAAASAPGLAPLLDAALASPSPLPPDLAELCWRRIVSAHVAAGRTDAALAALETARAAGFALSGVDAADLARADAAFDPRAAPGRVALDLAALGSPGGVWFSAGPDQPVDHPGVFVPTAGGRSFSVDQRPGPHPLRWVVYDAAPAAGVPDLPPSRFVSGNVHVPTGGAVTITAAAPAVARAAAAPPTDLLSAPADGARRVVLLVWDCADWRIVRYLQARGELSALAALEDAGAHAVVRSSPPYTAAAIGALVEPAAPGTGGVLQTMHELGREAGERRADHRNPLAPLSLFLPEAPDTVARLGAGDLRVVNLLYSHGVLDAARHGEVVGPHGAHGEPLQVPAFRPLTDVEKTAAVSLATTEVAAAPNLFAETAVLMDTTAELIATDAADVLLVRFGALDVLTHAAFAGTVSGTQDDGAGVLFDLYRYLDARTAEIAAALDADDVLLVVSDHGARTALQHDEAALFVAAGAGIPAGVRLDGTPDWRGLPRLIGELAGVPDAVADFPRSSLSDMLTPLPEDPP